MVDFFKKEKPFQGITGFGGGAAGNAVAGAAEAGWNGVGASGGTTYDYTCPLGEFRVHKFTSTSATSIPRAIAASLQNSLGIFGPRTIV